jgi:three-Cys-motif partner protein
MELDEHYKGREHSFIKHELLKGYLEVLLNIVALSGVKEFVYVDCFAGPWSDESESISGTSIAISLTILKNVKESLASQFGVNGIKIKAIYIEENNKRYKRLDNYLKGSCPEVIECRSLHGDFYKHQNEILELCGEKAFAFFFVDPLGWLDVGVPRLKKLLERPRSEFLITFMYDFLNRAIGMGDFKNQVEQMIGKLTDKDAIELNNLSSKNRADWVVRRYRERLKEEMGSSDGYIPRAFHAEVLNTKKERVHYHLVYLTRHFKGIIKFAEASEKVSIIQKIVRFQTRLNNDPNMSLFPAKPDFLPEDKNQVDIEDVKNYWLSKLSKTPKQFGEKSLAAMLEETGWMVSDLQKAFKELINEEKVKNLDGSRKRKKHFIHFEKNERLVRCV